MDVAIMFFDTKTRSEILVCKYIFQKAFNFDLKYLLNMIWKGVSCDFLNELVIGKL